MTQKPAANLRSYLAQWGVKVKEIISQTGRPRSTVDDWWKRQDLKMLDNAVKAILWDKATTPKAKSFAIKRKLGELPPTK
ncbi:MAG: hypothetical protein ACPHZ7_11355 [Vibrio toranzoniae]